MCFSMVSRASFNNIKTLWYPEVHHHCPQGLIMLAGTKFDLVFDPVTLQNLEDNNQSPVTVEEGMQLAEEIGAVGFVPFSSLTGLNVDLLFEQAVRAFLFGQTGPPKQKTGCIVQ
eukprot:TRINITY_DN4434_c0_g1_i1.p1 TRINITY_DN4434_c0_g1~~TRINITY_DN4434_c0_g1_i1.p1  ORF type:complete len:115 (-),score=18.73 TRINITY_DN4434_c0_g1_i1:27-371(-)